MTERTVKLVWTAPVGPEPEYYELNRFVDDGAGGHLEYQRIIDGDKTDIEIPEWRGTHDLKLYAIYRGNLRSPPVTLHRAFAITDIKPRYVNDQDAGTTIVGIVVTFATVKDREYTLEKTSDMVNWTPVATAIAPGDKLEIGGDIKIGAVAENYRVKEAM